MGRPPWRYVPDDDQLHLIRREVRGVAEALCSLRAVAVEAGAEAEDHPRCGACVRVYGELAGSAGG